MTVVASGDCLVLELTRGNFLDVFTVFEDRNHLPVWAPEQVRKILLNSKPGMRSEYEISCILSFIKFYKFFQQFSLEMQVAFASSLTLNSHLAGDVLVREGGTNKKLRVSATLLGVLLSRL